MEVVCSVLEIVIWNENFKKPVTALAGNIQLFFDNTQQR